MYTFVQSHNIAHLSCFSVVQKPKGTINSGVLLNNDIVGDNDDFSLPHIVFVQCRTSRTCTLLFLPAYSKINRCLFFIFFSHLAVHGVTRSVVCNVYYAYKSQLFVCVLKPSRNFNVGRFTGSRVRATKCTEKRRSPRGI